MEIKYEPFRHVWYVEKNGIICYVPEWAVEYIKGVESENEKLRELIADVHEALCADKAGMFHRLILASMEDDMRELGIEVDG